MMTRQLFLLFLTLFLTPPKVLAITPTDTTITVPSPPDTETAENPNPLVRTPEKAGLVLETPPAPTKKTPLYHLEPRPSLTLALSRALEVQDAEHSGWLGLHIAPWMTATTRIQVGIDIHGDDGWLQVALHSLPTRNLYRLYWGGGVSVILNAHDELRPFLKLKNYHAFLAGGWELQLLKSQNIRFEASYHQATESAYARATLGYTFLF